MGLKDSQGHRWVFMQPFRIPDRIDPKVTYLKRWRIVETPWFALYLHFIHTPDWSKYLHDHPWNFTSLILWGGYEERFGRDDVDAAYHAKGFKFTTYTRRWRVGSLHRFKRGQFHAITKLGKSPTVSLIFVGKRSGDWGFMTRDGWREHNGYLAEVWDKGEE